MTKITSSPNCGNSPKMEFIKQFNIAFANGDIERIITSVTDDIVWDIIGDKKIKGKEHFTKELEKMRSLETAELIIEQILSHGKEGAANGIIRMQNGQQYAFADFYTFKGASGTQIKAITSYVLEV
jgi:hypothetical protein